MKKSESLALRNPGFSLRDLAGVVFRRKWLIVFTLLTAGIAATVFAWMTPEMYQSRMKILVRNMRAEIPLTAGSDSVSDRQEVSQAQLGSEIELLKSYDLLERVVRETKLAKPSQPGAKITEADIEKASAKLGKELDISVVNKSNMIEVGYASKSPKEAAAVLRRLAELYLDKHLELHSPPGAYEFFKEQADRYEQDLRSSENILSGFQQKENVVEINQQKELTFSRLVDARSKLKEIDGTINETDKRIAALEKQLSGMDGRIRTQNRVIPNQYSSERLNTMLIELRNRRIQLLTKFQPDDRVVREVDDQIKVTTEALDKALKSTSSEESYDVNPLRQTLEGELTRAKVEQAGRNALKKNLSEQVARYEAELAKLEKVTPVHEKLSREVRQNTESYQLYAKKQEESRINDALDKQKISNVSIAEEPFVPHLPNKGSKLLAAIMGIGLGFLICGGGVFTTELLRDTFLSPRELEDFIDYPVLATIPFQTIEERRETIKNQSLAGNIDEVYLIEEADEGDYVEYVEEK
jgi:uncharacterized protein involved in exopolysaccharide biosynthesis